MELIYLWINNYKNLNDIGILLNSSYTVDILKTDKEGKKNIYLSKKKDYINIFGNNLNITTIIGNNGSGKSTIINAISAILRSISNVYTAFPQINLYDDLSIPQEYCFIMKQEGKYIAFCSNPSKFLLKINVAGQSYKASYLDIPNNQFMFEMRTNIQTVNKKINVAKFIPFFRGEETFYPEFSLWNGIFAITNIKIKNYFYYDRFRLYDTVRNLIELYNFNYRFGNKQKLKLFEDNENLYFDLYSPYLDLYQGLQWANRRIQNLKDENYDITQVISRSFSTFSSYTKKHTYKNINDILKTLLPKMFFAYAIGEILEIMQKDSTSEKLAEQLRKELHNFPKGRFPLSKQRIQFYINVTGLVKTKRIKDMLQAYIEYEGNNIEESEAKDILRDMYEVVQSSGYSKSLILKLKDDLMIPITNMKNMPDYVTKIEALKGISKNLYKKGSYGEVYDYMQLSTGEQRILKFMADVYLAANLNVLNKNSKLPETNLFLFDEMDLSWHPEWQRKMIYYIKNLFEKILSKKTERKINLIFTTHSPIILSDMPQNNVVFLTKSSNENNLQTFGANINDLFNDGLFFDCPDCLPMGEFAKQEIEKIFDTLQNHDIKINQKELEAKIDLIGEPMLRNSLQELLYKRSDYSFGNKKYEILRNENLRLKIELEKYKEKDNNKNETNRC